MLTQIDLVFLDPKTAKMQKQFIHNTTQDSIMIFNHDMQLQIDYIEWVLQKIEINKIPNDRLEALFKK